MYLFFIDDSFQANPKRSKMGPMLAVGGKICRDTCVKAVSDDLGALCTGFGFPQGERFKWSPGNELWMKKNLVREGRQSFQEQAIQILAKYGCQTVFVAVDKNCRPADPKSKTPEMDVSKLLIERADWFFEQQNDIGATVVNRQSGNMKQEEAFLLAIIFSSEKSKVLLQMTPVCKMEPLIP